MAANKGQEYRDNKANDFTIDNDDESDIQSEASEPIIVIESTSTAPFAPKEAKVAGLSDEERLMKNHFDCYQSWFESLLPDVRVVTRTIMPDFAFYKAEIAKVEAIVKPDLFLRIPTNADDGKIVYKAFLTHSFVWAPVQQDFMNIVARGRKDENFPGYFTADLADIDFQREVIEKLLKFLYNGRLHFTEKELPKLKALAVKMEIPHFAKAVEEAKVNGDLKHNNPFHGATTKNGVRKDRIEKHHGKRNFKGVQKNRNSSAKEQKKELIQKALLHLLK